MIFVDTSAWYARYTPKDKDYAAARKFHRSVNETLISTDYVIDESLTLFKVRGNAERARQFGRAVFAGKLAQIEWVSQSDVEQAWSVFDSYRDKDWSFTDCVSFVIMRRLGINKAFAFDDHFRQFGTVVVSP